MAAECLTTYAYSQRSLSTQLNTSLIIKKQRMKVKTMFMLLGLSLFCKCIGFIWMLTLNSTQEWIKYKLFFTLEACYNAFTPFTLSA